MKRIIKAALIVTGVLLVFGSPGACERGMISLGQAILQAVIGFVMWWAANRLSKAERKRK